MSSSVFARRALRALVVGCALLASVGARAAYAGIVVDDDKGQCPKAGFPTISRALAFAPPGATILVCPGRYTEQLRMTKPGVRVVGLTGNPLDVIVRAVPFFPHPRPQPGLPAIVDMAAPSTALQNVSLHGTDATGVFVHNGRGPFTGASVISNVRIRRAGSARGGSDFGDVVGNPLQVFERFDFSPGRVVVRDSRYDGSGSAIRVH